MVREKRIGKPYVWNAWALEVPPSQLEACALWAQYLWRIEPAEIIQRWEDDGGPTGAALKGPFIDLCRLETMGGPG